MRLCEVRDYHRLEIWRARMRWRSRSIYHLLSARDRRALIHRRWRQLSSEAVEIRRMTYTYRKRLLEDDQ